MDSDQQKDEEVESRWGNRCWVATATAWLEGINGFGGCLNARSQQAHKCFTVGTVGLSLTLSLSQRRRRQPAPQSILLLACRGNSRTEAGRQVTHDCAGPPPCPLPIGNIGWLVSLFIISQYVIHRLLLSEQYWCQHRRGVNTPFSPLMSRQWVLDFHPDISIIGFIDLGWGPALLGR